MFLKEIFFWWHSKGLSSHSKETLMGDGTELYAGLSLSHFYIKDISVSEHTFYFMFLSTPPALIEHVCFCHLHLSNQLHIQQFGLRSSFVPECSLIYTKYFSYTSDFLLKMWICNIKKMNLEIQWGVFVWNKTTVTHWKHTTAADSRSQITRCEITAVYNSDNGWLCLVS